MMAFQPLLLVVMRVLLSVLVPRNTPEPGACILATYV
jgi:hypothetical protein